MKLSEIKPNEENPRIIKEDKLKLLSASIENFKKMMTLRPIVIDENNVILGGNMRYRALLSSGYTEIPDEWVKKVEGLPEEKKKEFIIKDNVPMGAWDWDVLANEWDSDNLVEWGLDVPDWDSKIGKDLDFEETEDVSIAKEVVLCKVDFSIYKEFKDYLAEMKKKYQELFEYTNMNGTPTGKK